MRDRSEYPGGDESLDRLLNGAQWPQPGALRLARLEREWDRTLARRELRRRRVRVLAAAAVFMATAFGLWWMSAGAPREQLVAPGRLERRDVPAIGRTEPQQPLLSEDSPAPRMQGDLLPGRAPSAYELLVLRAKENRPKTTRDDPLERIVARLIAEPDAEVETLVAPLMVRRAAYEGRLIESIPERSVGRRLAETRILVALGSPRCVPLLAQLSREEPTRRVALAGLKRLADSAALATLASAEPDEPARRELLAALLDRGDPLSVRLFLDAVRDPRTGRSALAAFEGSVRPPIDALVGVLTGPDVERRAAAAGLLGRSKHPDAIARLIEMAKNDSTRQPALMALLASDDPRARRLLAEAWNHPQARSAVQLAQLEWQVAAWQVSLPNVPEVY